MDNSSIYREQFLRHYGILGMRWGTRKRRVEKSSSTSSKTNPTPASGKRRMTNKELKARINRLKLEQEYAKLTTVPKPETKSRVDSLVKQAGNIASLTSSATTIYKNLESIGVIPKK